MRGFFDLVSLMALDLISDGIVFLGSFDLIEVCMYGSPGDGSFLSIDLVDLENN